MYIETMLEAQNPVAKAALRSTANSCVMRACGIALRLAMLSHRMIGNGIDGYNDLRAVRDAAKQSADWFKGTGKDAELPETTMHNLMALYLSIQNRMVDEDFFAPMSIDDAFMLMSQPQGAEVDKEDDVIKALAEISGESIEDLMARKEADNQKQADRNRDLAPLARTFLDECADNGADEDTQLAQLPINVQFAVFCKAVDGAANQFDRELTRTMRFSNSKSAVLRSLALSDTAAGKATLNELEAMLTKYIDDHKSELDL